MYLVLIDAHSKWIEAFCTPSATSSAVIEELRPLFAQFGLPETIVTDNGTCFVSVEIDNFFATNGIRHDTYHPVTRRESSANCEKRIEENQGRKCEIEIG